MWAKKWPPRWRMEGLALATLDSERPFTEGALEVAEGRIVAVGTDLPPAEPAVVLLDRRGYLALPGYIQGHLHLCQTLFRGLAEGRRLHRWLAERIWPLEAAHDPESLAASARLGIAEALLHGATTILDMGTVHHTDVIAETAWETGIRAILGKALMDAGDDVPRALRQAGETALTEALDLHARWRGRGAGRIGWAFAPRFTLSVSAPLWEEIAAEARAGQLAIHTHVSETQWENETCAALHGCRPIEALERWGVLAAGAILVHAIWIDAADREMLAHHGAGLVHCPGSNAKLGSGIIDLVALREAGIPVALGSDGAACNDALALPLEMRLAAQLQAIAYGPEHLAPEAPLAMATIEGARALGLAEEIGSLTPGKQADIQLYRCEDLSWAPEMPTGAAIMNVSTGVRPHEVFVAGAPLVLAGELTGPSLAHLQRAASEQRKRLLERAQIDV